LGYRSSIAAGKTGLPAFSAWSALGFCSLAASPERMMLEIFGDSYRANMARTSRIFPLIF